MLCLFVELQGVQYEINYAQALGSTSSRRSIIGNSVSLSRTTMGKQTLLSSGATKPMVRQARQHFTRSDFSAHSTELLLTLALRSPPQHLRAPHDVMNLAQVFGLSPHHARTAIVHVASAVVAHGDIRASTHKGVVRRLDATDVSASFPQRIASGSGDGGSGGKHTSTIDLDAMDEA